MNSNRFQNAAKVAVGGHFSKAHSVPD